MIKLKTTILLYSICDYMILTLKNIQKYILLKIES
jgi:hypothetical protein